MPSFSFQISARLMSHLGEALISDELVALLELIKNSYDADANKSSINIDTLFVNEYGQGKIIVCDDGSGMNLDIIANSFLKLATDFKVKKQKISPKYKRLSLGNKGVGRLSLQRLGEFVKVITNDGINEYSFVIDWKAFNDDIAIQDVNINVIENEEHILDKHGTKMEIYGLKNIELWKNKDTFLRFKNEIISMLNPYEEDESKFSIFFCLDEYRFASDKYDVKLIESLADSTVKFKYYSSTKILSINIERKKKYADSRLNEAKKRYNDLGFDLEELDLNAKYSNLIQSYDINLKDISKSYSKIKNDILIKDSEGEEYLPGNFEGKYFAFDKTPSRFTKENKDFLDMINGVKLFRSNFRILPYGDNNTEWLDFTKLSQTYASNIYKAHSVAGYIYINGEENLNKLREMTNRQGLLEDNYGKNFFTILRKIVSRVIVDSDMVFRDDFVANRTKVNSAKSGDEIFLFNKKILLRKRINHTEEILKESGNLLDDSKPNIFDTPEMTAYKDSIQKIACSINQDAKKIQTSIEAEKNLINDEKKILQKYKIVMANSIIAESLAHEILKLAIKTKNSATIIRKELLKKEADSKKINVNLDIINSSMQFLYRNASILDSNSYIKKNNFESVDIKELLENIINTFPLFDSEVNNTCKIILSGDTVVLDIIKNNFVVTIENILINSKYWLEKNGIKNPTIFININDKEITLFDNGYGISIDVENTLFDAFVTAKPDSEGRGLGLYISKQLINEINGNIELSEERNQYGNRYKFVIKFQ